jgi:2',3'-cyclic-nucleotide 2'-phosphodiesterase (5'-nucleotidase family)
MIQLKWPSIFLKKKSTLYSNSPKWVIALTVFTLLVSCNKSPLAILSTGDMIRLDSQYRAVDKNIDKLIVPYNAKFSALIDEIVGYTSKPMHVRRPESALGNLLADYLLEYGLDHIDSNIDMAVFNKGGFRIPLPPGAITFGHVMQLMPFDNTMVVISLNGLQMKQLAEIMVEGGGDPIAGPNEVRLEKSSEKVSLRLNQMEIKVDEDYRVLTSSYLAQGGDNYYIFPEGDFLVDSGIMIRDALEESFRTKTSATNPAQAEIEGRVIIK